MLCGRLLNNLHGALKNELVVERGLDRVGLHLELRHL